MNNLTPEQLAFRAGYEQGRFDAQVEREWIGLTNNELQPIADEYRILFGSWVEDFARAIEAKLKEKNK